MSRRSERGAGRLLAGLALAAVIVAVALVLLLGGSGGGGGRIGAGTGERDVKRWTAPTARPLGDRAAAALVARAPEDRPGNAAANRYVPTRAQLAAFRAAQLRARAENVYNPLSVYVTGRPGIPDPTTDELIQWVSHKWGIPTDWIRAQLTIESNWRQGQLGDSESVRSRWLHLYPAFSREHPGHSVYQSLGIAQVKWIPDGSVGAGTEPLRWRSTAFNLDYYAATLRDYYDGDCRWCSAGYRRGEAWRSVGAWFSPQPWGNGEAAGYIARVRAALAAHPWTHGGF